MVKRQFLQFILPFGLPLLAGAAHTCYDLALIVTAHSKTRQIIIPFLSLDNRNLISDRYTAIASSVTAVLPMVPVGGTYNISSTYCEPDEPTESVQLLAHGTSYNKKYWNVFRLPVQQAERYSWVNFATEKGYATFAIDRLGTGDSTLADPLLEVQMSLEAEILHGIVGMLRAGAVKGRHFQKVALVGHSTGSIIGKLVSVNHSEDFDALVLAGFTTHVPELLYYNSSEIPLPAALVNPSKWGQRHLGLTFPLKSTIERSFYGSNGNYDPTIVAQDFDNTEPFSMGQVVTPNSALNPSPSYAKPVHGLVGQHDTDRCNGTCSYGPTNIPGNIAGVFPPSRNFTYHIVPNTGHNLNLHYSAAESFEVAHYSLR
ncbi:hypothetical protein AJ79_03837 [Helicocarpus griseus UAMH5409]|uniref:AB hydrolase-1 domain-containing protein n=1 Tax=Helicocarpus griseus UAMH5409 TaxID=1447875 RepID=A0A2B7XVU5_9EURO|nr:hypothetical protein AJ79_03837 [Helicocarpus griseus UAMH5409]